MVTEERNSPLLSSEEQALVQGLRQGERAAYRRLFEQYYPSLTIFALRYLNDEDDAKEQVQKVFLTLYQKRATLTVQQNLKAYLYKSVYHACLNERQRALTRQRHQQQAAEALPSFEDKDPLVESENVARIYRAIEALPSQCRRIFTMNRLEGMTNQAIATQLALSKRTVETQISKALRALREQLL